MPLVPLRQHASSSIRRKQQLTWGFCMHPSPAGDPRLASVTEGWSSGIDASQPIGDMQGGYCDSCHCTGKVNFLLGDLETSGNVNRPC
ncbi:hypothetical protein SKAU_G00141770 [Synaphobranchus kaupii]|uniref:Uncharacterized protein n=1 Tax=Synaphobranchus kaupii TaxID=118154 RepID=A0A9Q1J427_SYNKA|nr:hypothetical protein SKAU_G00141770 [Synaphobranchus kaupii]